MGQRRFSNMALIYIERKYANSVLNNDLDRIVDIFGRLNGSYFSVLTCSTCNHLKYLVSGWC